MNRNSRLIRKKYFEYFSSTFALTLSIYAAAIVDAILIGNLLGSNALSVINITSPIVFIKNIVLTLFVYGGSTLAAQYKGRRDADSANRVFTISVVIGATISAVVVVIGMLLSAPTAALLTGGNEYYDATLEYLIPLWLNGPLILFVNGMASFARMDSHNKLATALPIVSNLVNLVLDYVFMAHFGWGIAGAGWATVAGYVVGAFMTLPYFLSKDKGFRFVRLTLANIRLMWESVKTGLATCMIQVCNAFRTAIINAIILASLLVAGFNVASVCFMAFNIALIFIDGGSTTILPICGALYGEKDYKGLRHIFKISLIVTEAVSLAVMLIFELFPNLISALFALKSAEAQAMFTHAFRIYAVCIPFYAFNFILRAFYQSTGNRNAATALSVLEGFVVIVPVVFLISRVNTEWIWISFTIAQLLSSVLMIVVMQFRAKRKGMTGFLMLPKDGGSQTLDVTIRNSVDEAVDAAHQIVDFCNENGVERNISHDIGVAVEELCVNTAKYAFSSRSDSIDIYLKISEDCITLKLRDNGKIFNPTEYIDDSGKEVTGLGLVRSLSTDTTYNRVIGFNVTVVTVNRV